MRRKEHLFDPNHVVAAFMLILLGAAFFLMVKVYGNEYAFKPASDEILKIANCRPEYTPSGQLKYYWVNTKGINLTNTSRASSLWSWSPSKYHHQAVVQIRVSNSGGSGAYIGNNLVLTAAHVASRGQMATAIWQNGYRASGRVLASYGHPYDVSVFKVNMPNPDTPVKLEVSPVAPKPGDYLEYCGFGGPGDNLRHFWGLTRTATDENRISGHAYLLNGDSGGPILYKGKIVGVNSGGSHLSNFGLRGWPAHYPARSCNVKPVHKLLCSVGIHGPGCQ